MSHKYHLVGMNFGQQPIDSSPSRPMLRNKRDRKRPLNFSWPRFLKQSQHRQQRRPISGRLPADFFSANREQVSLCSNCVKHVYASGSNFRGVPCSNVHEQFIGMIHLRAAHTSGL